MGTKILNIVTSVRFLQLLVVAVLQSLVVLNVIDSVQGEALVLIFQTLLAGSVVVGSIDSAAKKSAPIIVVAQPEIVENVDVEKLKAQLK